MVVVDTRDDSDLGVCGCCGIEPASEAGEAGDAAKARQYYAKAVALADGVDTSRVEIVEARAFVAKN